MTDQYSAGSVTSPQVDYESGSVCGEKKKNSKHQRNVKNNVKTEIIYICHWETKEKKKEKTPASQKSEKQKTLWMVCLEIDSELESTAMLIYRPRFLESSCNEKAKSAATNAQSRPALINSSLQSPDFIVEALKHQLCAQDKWG